MCKLGPIRACGKDDIIRPVARRKRPRDGNSLEVLGSGGFPVFSLSTQGQLPPDLTAHSIELSAALRKERACIISFGPGLADELDSAYAKLFTATKGCRPACKCNGHVHVSAADGQCLTTAGMKHIQEKHRSIARYKRQPGTWHPCMQVCQSLSACT